MNIERNKIMIWLRWSVITTFTTIFKQVTAEFYEELVNLKNRMQSTWLNKTVRERASIMYYPK